MSKFIYEPLQVYSEIKWLYKQSVPNNILQNDIGEDVSRALKFKKRPADLISGERRHEIVNYMVDGKRAFAYSKQEKQYIPYNIPKDAYDLFFYNYGFK